MRIGILTQPLHTNYGGLLQAYALQRILKDRGHEVWLINRYYNQSRIYRTLSAIKHLLLSSVSCIKGGDSWQNVYRRFRDSFSTALQFKKTYIIPCTECLTSDKALRHFANKMKFDAYIVGSDQVWRPAYTPNIYNYFLDFVPNDNAKKLAYAASFGTDDWEFSTQETEGCKKLLQQFDCVSTREKSGIDLCNRYLDRHDVVSVLDPTMLLPPEKYDSIIARASLPVSDEKFIVSYLLDNTPSKQKLLDDLKKKMDRKVYKAQGGLKICVNKHLKQLATVEEWLYGFRYADFAVIDSFHGCVFSILYHIPFVVIGNKKRGMSRFQSLLSLFELEERLIDESTSIDHIMTLKVIDWDKVDHILDEQRKLSLSFLSKLN